MRKTCRLLNRMLLKMKKILSTEKQAVDSERIERYIKEVEEYLRKYKDQITEDNAKQAVSDFKDEWLVTFDYMEDLTESMESKYGTALFISSRAIALLSLLTEEEVLRLEKNIYSFDKKDEARYKFNYKKTLFFNLGLCWHKLGNLYRDKAIESFKKYIYYLITQSFNTAYFTEAYKFKKCDGYLYQSLINEELNLSSPTVFNDPFDCPILELLNNKDEVAPLIREAYHNCLKIACFMKKEKLPYEKDGDTIYDEMKSLDDKEEFLNPLMWAHYADNHSGICIKYGFNGSITQLSGDNPSVVSFFQDVKYSDEDLNQYSQRDSISLKDSFFLKGKPWKYENELRFLYFDIEGKDKYKQIKILNCIEAIYFGVRCSENDQETIRKILKEKKFIKKGIDEETMVEKDIEFYKMEIDKSNFGQLKAIKI